MSRKPPGPDIREAVAAVIYHPQEPSQILLVQRPEAPPEGPEEELPGIWGLPAATLGPGESAKEALERLGRQKLGLPLAGSLAPVRLLGRGHQERQGYTLRMWLYEALPDAPEPHLPPGGAGEVTRYVAWRWAGPEALAAGARAGSLCCRLLLQARP